MAGGRPEPGTAVLIVKTESSTNVVTIDLGMSDEGKLATLEVWLTSATFLLGLDMEQLAAHLQMEE